MVIIPGTYKDFAPRHPRTPSSYDICTVHGIANHETHDDQRVIIERMTGGGSHKLEHLTLLEFQEQLDREGHKTPRFVFIQSNYFQD